MSSKKSISQWTGAIISVIALPFVGSFSWLITISCMDEWGVKSLVVTGLMFVAMTAVITIIVAWTVSKIVEFIIN